MENVFFGGRDASPEQLEKAESAALKGPCSVQYKGFMRCLENNEEDAEKCDWAFDMFKECQTCMFSYKALPAYAHANLSSSEEIGIQSVGR